MVSTHDDVSQYVRPPSLDDTRERLDEPAGRSLAGGTHLLAPSTSHPESAVVVDLQALPLGQLSATEGELTIGAMITLQTLVEGTSGLLAEAAQREAPRQVRQMATVGGTIAAAQPESELVTALLVLDARLHLADGYEVPLAEWMPEERRLITRVVVPVSTAGTGAARVARTPADRPIVLVCALAGVEGDTLATLRLAASGVAARPVRLFDVEETLVGKTTAEVLEETASVVQWSIEPASDFRGSSEYRRVMAGVLARRALAAALGEGASHGA
ncbi:MAG: FAD binding domain-containing protein [Ardenticatenaceae bacterium]|nr:FAD binding domain-containing protein [Ardenticatenaceae bacterium]HBY95049.1 hypothetical protein [Chloroflexota bacterium]